MIKKILKINLLGALLLSTNLVANAQNSCDNLTGCKKKICDIEQNIAIAKKNDNKSQVDGLEISLKKVNTHCTDDKLMKDLEDKIEDTEKDLQEDKENYEEAVKENKSDKVEKYKSKMAEENSKIERLNKELNQLK